MTAKSNSFQSSFEGEKTVLMPIWLDEVFAKGKGDANAIAAAFNADPRVKKAFADAAAAYAEHDAFAKANPRVVGLSSTQAARVKFLDEIDGD
jgi:hypothetical protein